MVQLSYPGVYVQEVPSGVRTIVGVPTSITAFVGRATGGPINEPNLINGWADYERRFGGLSVDSTMSYAVQGFYLNGGSQAIIVRVVHDDAAKAAISLPASGVSPGVLLLEAASAGEWGNRLSASVDHDSDKGIEDRSPAVDHTVFNLFIQYKVRAGAEEVEGEQFLGVSTDPSHRRYLPIVLERDSQFIRAVAGGVPARRPDSTVIRLTAIKIDPGWVGASGGTDGGDVDDSDIIGSEDQKTGIYALNRADLFNLLCIPPPRRRRADEKFDAPGTFTTSNVYASALRLCVDRRAMLLVDPNPEWGTNVDTAVQKAIAGRDALGLNGAFARNAALYFPCVRQLDSLREDVVDTFVPSGIVAGIMTRTDNSRGVWKAPAGLDAAINGVQGLQVNLSDLENGLLNPLGINCLRSFPVNGRLVWGARTMRGADQAADEYKYVPVRRLALYLEESLYRGSQWVVFEPNDEPLWAQIRMSVGSFMQNLFRQGAFQGRSPREAYLVKCDAETTTQNDINLGIVNILVGFAPLKPAEFVVLKIQQLAGQVQA